MKPKTRFLKWYDKLSDEAVSNLIWKPYTNHPMSLQVVWLEIIHDTKLGDKLLEEMGWKE